MILFIIFLYIIGTCVNAFKSSTPSSSSSTIQSSNIDASISSSAISSPESREFRTKVVGVTHGKRQEYLEECYSGQEITIKNNPSDDYPHAMAVYTMLENEDGRERRVMLGYLKNDLAKEIFEELYDEDAELCGEILDITGGDPDKPSRGCNISFWI